MLRVDFEANACVARGGGVAVFVGVVTSAGFDVVAITLHARQAERVVKRTLNTRSTAHARFHFFGFVRTHANADIGRKSALALAREQLDYAANGIRAIDRRRRAAQHFDTVDVRQRNLLPHRTAGRLRVHAHTVDVNRREAPLSAAQKHVSRVANAAVARNLYARQTRQHIDDAGSSAVFDGFTVHDGDVSHQVRQPLLRAGRRDYGFAQRRRVQVLR